MKWNDQIAQSRIKLFGGLAIALALSFSQSAWALGTASGTTINNLATLNYSVGAVAQPAVGSSPTGNSVGPGTNTGFVVDNKVNLTVATVDVAAVPVVPGQTNVVATFTVTNTGNTVQDYSLGVINLPSGTTVFAANDNFDTGACTAYAKSSPAGPFVLGVDNVPANIFIDELAPDATKTVYVLCASIPGTQVNNDQANISLTATTATGGTAGAQGAASVATAGANTAGVDIVFADPATVANGSGTDPGQTARDAIGVARDAYRVAAVTAAVTKTATCNPAPLNCSQAKTGTLITYQIKVDVTGSGTATSLIITDPLPSNVTYVAGTLNVTPAAVSATVTTGTATIDLGNVAVTPATPKTFIITLNATIN